LGVEHEVQDTVRDARHVGLPRRYALVILGDCGMRVVPLPPTGSVVVGRGIEADVRVSDVRISRQHARVHIGASLRIEDLHSANGTVVTGRRLAAGKSRVLEPGEAIALGDTTLLVRSESAAPLADCSSDGTEEPEVGEAMRAVLDLADRASASMLSVLLLGETGVGKDVVAERIHRASPRANGPLLRLNCAALSPALLASELFGHEKGAFTGAMCAQPGLLQSASGGTVFFDEVGELPLELQTKLLLVLERREVLPVGAVRPRPIDVRFISATNLRLSEAVDTGAFRRDLYYRLNGVAIEVPPLRARPTEIDGLAARFAHEAARSIGRTAPAALRAYDWPGNIRELRSVIERAVLLGPAGALGLPAIAPMIASASSASSPAQDAASTTEAEPTEEQEIIDTLAYCGGNQSRAAKLLGISRNTLIARIEKYGLARPLAPRRTWK
jgi:two-component system, NtrC family, response regulator AtoC